MFEFDQVLKRVEKMGDLFAPVLTMKQKLPKLEGIDGGKAEAIKTGLEMAAQAEKPAAARAKPASIKSKGTTIRTSSTRKRTRKG